MIKSIEVHSSRTDVDFAELNTFETFIYDSRVYQKIPPVFSVNPTYSKEWNAIDINIFALAHIDDDQLVDPVDIEISINVFDKKFLPRRE